MAVIKIAKRGGDPGGLIRYLFGKGKNNEHVLQRTICGTTHHVSGADLSSVRIHQVSSDLRAFSQLNPQSRIGQDHKHIWHAAISLPPGETLDDRGWSRLAQEYMRGMGFDDPQKPAIRWTAVHHGTSREGNDHIHIVMSMIRQDGTKVRVHEDAKRSRPVLTGIESRLGLTVLQPPPNGARPITYKAGERGAAEDKGLPIAREDLALKVRAAATASKTEAEFVRRLRAQGLDVRPRQTDGQVTGYSVGINGGPGWAGGKLARDLSLPRLRPTWTGAPADAVGEWLSGKNETPRIKYGRETRKNIPIPGDVKQELAAAHFRLASAKAEDFPEISSDLAGALALASTFDPRLQAMSKEVARAAQTTGPRQSAGGTFLSLGLFVMALQDKDPRTREVLMIRQVVAMLVTLVQTHRARTTALNKERSAGMSQPDATDELVETGVTMGVTLGAAGVQMALQRLGQRGPKNPPKAQDRAGAAGSGAVLAALEDQGPETLVQDPATAKTLLREQTDRKLDALGIYGQARSPLDEMDHDQMLELAQALDSTISETPGAPAKEFLLEYYKEDSLIGDRDWVQYASPEQANERLVELAAAGKIPGAEALTGWADAPTPEAILDYVQRDHNGEILREAPAPEQAPAPVQEVPSVIPNWRTGNEPMTPNQRFTLKQYCKQFGLDPNTDLSITLDDGTSVKFGQFTKAQASGAISEFGRVQREGTPSNAPVGVGVGGADFQSSVAQQTILNLPNGIDPNAQAPLVQPDIGKNQGRSGGRF